MPKYHGIFSKHFISINTSYHFYKVIQSLVFNDTPLYLK